MGTKFEFDENEFFLELSVCYVLSFRAHINCNKAGWSTLGQAGRSGLLVMMMVLFVIAFMEMMICSSSSDGDDVKCREK